jgi:hypothetical protein
MFIIMVQEVKVTSMFYLVTCHVVKSVTNMGIKLYNNLPTEIKKAYRFKLFKNKLRFFFTTAIFLLLRTVF